MKKTYMDRLSDGSRLVDLPRSWCPSKNAALIHRWGEESGNTISMLLHICWPGGIRLQGGSVGPVYIYICWWSIVQIKKKRTNSWRREEGEMILYLDQVDLLRLWACWRGRGRRRNLHGCGLKICRLWVAEFVQKFEHFANWFKWNPDVLITCLRLSFSDIWRVKIFCKSSFLSSWNGGTSFQSQSFIFFSGLFGLFGGIRSSWIDIWRPYNPT